MKTEFELFFHLKETSESKLDELSQALEPVKLVHPADALGAYISRVGQSKDRLSLNIPHLNTTVKFSVTDPIENIEKNIRFANVASSLRASLITNSIINKKVLKISFIVGKSDKSDEAKVLSEFYSDLFFTGLA